MACLSVLLLAVSGVFPAWAEAWDAQRQGTVMVNTSYVTGSGDGQKRNPVNNVEVSLYQMASAGMEAGWLLYEPQPGLEQYREFFNSGFSGEDNAARAKELSDFSGLESFRAGEAAKTDEAGNVSFAGLKPGMYLVVQTAERSGFYKMGPFLVPVPSQADEGGWTHTVEARPKLEKKPGGNHGGGGGGGTTPTPPADSTAPEFPGEISPGGPPEGGTGTGDTFPEERLPQTGMRRFPVLVCVFAGLMCFGGGWFLGRKDKSRKQTFLMCLGLLGLLGAGIMEGKDYLEDRGAGEASAAALTEVRYWLDAGTADLPEVSTEGDTTDKAEKLSERQVLTASQSGYSGILTIPSLDLELPVQDQWSYPALRKTPCRYYGSAADADLVIFAHNYQHHFGKLKQMAKWDEVQFTDIEGRLHRYQVDEVMVVAPDEAEQMTGGEWDLILFTCTYGGENRIAVRCTEKPESIEEQAILREEAGRWNV